MTLKIDLILNQVNVLKYLLLISIKKVNYFGDNDGRRIKSRQSRRGQDYQADNGCINLLLKNFMAYESNVVQIKYLTKALILT